MTTTTKKTITSQIADKVADNKEVLSTMTKAELYNFASENGFATQHRFNKYVAALANIGVDYYNIAQQKTALAQLRDVAKKAPTVTFFTDFASKYNKFAIVDIEGNPIWYGTSFNDQFEQSAGELDTAKKAIWLAAKIKEHHKLDAINLVLIVDAQWLTYANGYQPGSDKGGKAQILATSALEKNINLRLEWVPSCENLADSYTRSKGYFKYQDSHYLSLIEA